MASVHIGRLLGPVGFSRTVAIKRLHPQFARDPEFVTMFLDEARLAARIRHPNVASTLDVVATQGELFLVMEYIQGESLAQLLRISNDAGKSIPQEIVRSIMSGVLHGLHAAHEAKSERGDPLGIVHRDVSPQNILVGTDGIARLLDFGIAKAASRAHVTRDRHIKGKLSYMAPEQIQNTEIDRRVDVYAAAVVTWELLTGKRLFLAESESGTLARVLTCSVPPPSAESRTVSFKLDQVVLRGLKRAREGRYATAREMALALESSGRLATASAVGEWVEQTAQVTLAARAADIAAVEQIDDMPAGSTSSQSLPVARKLELVNEPTADAPVEGETAEARSEPDVARAEDIQEEPPTQPEPGPSIKVGDADERTARPDIDAVGIIPDRRPSSSELAMATNRGGQVAHRSRRRWTATVGMVAVLGTFLAWYGNAQSSRHAAGRETGRKVMVETPTSANPTPAIPEPIPEVPAQVQSSATENTPPPVENSAAPIGPAESPRTAAVGGNASSRARALAEPAKSAEPREPAPVRAAEQKPASASLAGVARPSASKPSDCNPPYTVDEAGIKHYKRKCL